MKTKFSAVLFYLNFLYFFIIYRLDQKRLIFEHFRFRLWLGVRAQIDSTKVELKKTGKNREWRSLPGGARVWDWLILMYFIWSLMCGFEDITVALWFCFSRFTYLSSNFLFFIIFERKFSQNIFKVKGVSLDKNLFWRNCNV